MPIIDGLHPDTEQKREGSHRRTASTDERYQMSSHSSSLSAPAGRPPSVRLGQRRPASSECRGSTVTEISGSDSMLAWSSLLRGTFSLCVLHLDRDHLIVLRLDSSKAAILQLHTLGSWLAENACRSSVSETVLPEMRCAHHNEQHPSVGSSSAGASRVLTSFCLHFSFEVEYVCLVLLI